MQNVYEFFEKWQIEAVNVDPKKFSLFVAMAMDRLVEYMALCCYFEIPCIQKMDYHGYDGGLDKFPSEMFFKKEDFELSNYDKLVKDGLAKLDAYTERTTFNMKAISKRLKPTPLLALFCGIQSIADEVWRTVYYAELILERLRVTWKESGRAEISDGYLIVPIKGSECEAAMKAALDQSYELSRQLHEFWKLGFIVDYGDDDLYDDDVTVDWYAPDDERISDIILTEAEFVLASAMYRLGYFTPNHIE